MVDRLLVTLPHRTQRGRAYLVETYGEEATERVERLEPYLDSLDPERLKQLNGKVLDHQVRYVEGFLADQMDSEGSQQRQWVLNRLSFEIAEVAYWKGRGVSYEQPQQKPILERVDPKELHRIRGVLASRVERLYKETSVTGITLEDRTKLARRAFMLDQRVAFINIALSGREKIR